MKKLALALVCLVSVAFFASCNPEGDPTIYVLNEEGYVKTGDVVDVNTEFNFGFVMASSIETGSELTSLIIKVDDNTPDTISISGKDYTYRGTLVYELTREEIIGTSNIEAIVVDAAGKTASTTITLSINQPAQQLMTRTFEWYRLGNTITGLDEFGLEWKGNYPKDTYAKLIPQDGVKLFIFEAKDWDEVTTDVEKVAFFNAAIETQHTADEYFEVNVTQMDMTYNDVIGTVLPDGTCHLIRVNESHSQFISQGTETTIKGEAK